MKRVLLSAAMVLSITGAIAIPAYADSANVTVSQQIQDPVAKLQFQNSTGQAIDQPSITFPLRTASFKCQIGNAATLSTPEQRLFISVPDRVVNGWDVSLAPTNGTASGWNSGPITNALSIDDATNDGCDHRPDNAGPGGLLSVRTNEVVTAGSCSMGCDDAFNSPQVGRSTNFAETTAASLYSSNVAHIGWEGTLQNVKLEQTIPAGVAAGDYRLPMTVTLTEL